MKSVEGQLPAIDLTHSRTQAAWVAIAGGAGALAPPLATRVFDAGYLLLGTRVAMGIAIAAFLITLLAQRGNMLPIVVAAVLLDAAVSANFVLGQRAIYWLGAALRGRLNALYIAIAALRGDHSASESSGANVVQVLIQGTQIDTGQGPMFMHSFTGGYSDDELAAIGNFVIGQFGQRQGAITPEQFRARNASTEH